jgi:hypothetical protein
VSFRKETDEQVLLMINDNSVFILDRSFRPSELLISFIRLLNLSTADWKTTREKRKLPRARMDLVVFDVCHIILQERLKEYQTTLEVRSYPISRSPNQCLNEF